MTVPPLSSSLAVRSLPSHCLSSNAASTPSVIISAFKKALARALEIVEEISVPVDVSNDKDMLALIKTSIGTKFVSRWSIKCAGSPSRLFERSPWSTPPLARLQAATQARR